MKNKIIIYDDACPLCNWYTDLFLKYGLLTPQGRRAFSEIDGETLALLNTERACNEIPLIDTVTHEVFYGIDAMVEVLNDKFPIVKPIAHLKPINWFLRKLYKLISYNRKGIVAKVPSSIGFDCTPSYSYRYKKTFIAICFFVASMLIYFNVVTLFPTITALIIIVGLIVTILSIFTQDKNKLELYMQYQLQYMITSVLIIPVFFLLKYSLYGALLLLFIVITYSVYLGLQRIRYIKAL
ncbi:MAG: DCC1-like thiol-disulfide oxidoreductase family protein [Bacteroidia bacterium]